jgi:hypothetical protein
VGGVVVAPAALLLAPDAFVAAVSLIVKDEVIGNACNSLSPWCLCRDPGSDPDDGATFLLQAPGVPDVRAVSDDELSSLV